VSYALRRFNIPRRTHQRKGVMRSDAFPELYNKEWLEQKFLHDNKTARQIANQLGCSTWSVVKSLQRFGVKKNLDACPHKKDKSLPKGVIRKQGYLLVYSPQHPFTSGRGYIGQHRLVVEEAIGRYLTDLEEVHHVNEKRDDNRVENLLVMPDYKTHMRFHNNPPAWVPRCPHCSKPHPESLTGRPEGVPLLYVEE